MRLLLKGASAMQEGYYETGIQDVLPALAQLEESGRKEHLD